MTTETKKRLDFSVVHILEHEVALGDNPGVSEGCPIALGDMVFSDVMDVNHYEALRQTTRRVVNKRRNSMNGGNLSSSKSSANALRLDVSYRAKLLLEAGYSIEEIAAGTMQVQEIQRRRAASNQKTTWEKVSSLLSRPKPKQEEAAARSA